MPPTPVVTADASDTGLPDGSADLIVGEAMLTMCSPQKREQILAEAARVLSEGGRYAIHELGLTDAADDPDPQTARGEVGRDLSQTIKVGARPMKVAAWKKLFTDAGFEVTWTGTAPMRLLEPSRLLADEGLFGCIRIARNLKRRPEARRRVLQMRDSFRAHGKELTAVALVVTKKSAPTD